MSLNAVWLVIAASYPLVVLDFASLSVEDGDFWWTLAIGRAIWNAGALPATDPLAYTASGPYHVGQWLANLLVFGTYQLGGVELLILLRALIVAGVFVLLYLGCRRVGATPAISGLCTLLAFPLVNLGLSLRPQLFALVPFVLYLEATRHPGALGRSAYVLPLAMVFWANVHGSFVFGLALVAIALAGRGWGLGVRGWESGVGGQGQLPNANPDPQPPTPNPQMRRLLMLGGLSAIAPLLNPYGIGIVGYLRDVLAVAPARFQAGGMLTEWVPPRLDTPGGPMFFGSVVALIVVFVGARLRSASVSAAAQSGPADTPDLPTAEILRLLAFGFFALRSIRGILWWGLALPAALATLLQRILLRGAPTRATRGQPALNAALIGIAVAFSILSLPWWRGALPIVPPEARSIVQAAPLQRAADWLAANGGTQRPFHYIAWGPYLNWRFGPGQRIFVDGRFEAYDPRIFDDYALISTAAPGWEERLAAYGVDCLVLSATSQDGLVRALQGADTWRLAYSEGDVFVYRSREAP